MDFEIEALPYPVDALEPHIGARTLWIHHGKHHQGYMDKLQAQLEGKAEAALDLEELIRSSEGALFNNAAQIWNHTFYWKSMTPNGGGKPDGVLRTEIERDFGSVAEFKERFAEAASGEFGSGWAWLVASQQGHLAVYSSSDAENPLQTGSTPLLTLDVWEHAYYLDHQNDRGRYIQGFLDQLINWKFAAANRDRMKIEA